MLSEFTGFLSPLFLIKIVLITFNIRTKSHQPSTERPPRPILQPCKPSRQLRSASVRRSSNENWFRPAQLHVHSATHLDDCPRRHYRQPARVQVSVVAHEPTCVTDCDVYLSNEHHHHLPIYGAPIRNCMHSSSQQKHKNQKSEITAH